MALLTTLGTSWSGMRDPKLLQPIPSVETVKPEGPSCWYIISPGTSVPRIITAGSDSVVPSQAGRNRRPAAAFVIRRPPAAAIDSRRPGPGVGNRPAGAADIGPAGVAGNFGAAADTAAGWEVRRRSACRIGPAVQTPEAGAAAAAVRDRRGRRSLRS